MKNENITLVHSFWTKPSQKQKDLYGDDRAMGGWSHYQYHLMSWALSCLLAKKWYAKVVLVTDQQGKALLADTLQLPYTEVLVVLDELNEYPHDLWALGKLKAYAMQEGPFIHFDGDVFLFNALPQALHEAPLVAQNPEHNLPFYQDILGQMQQHNFWLPPVLQKAMQSTEGIVCANAGIIGGQQPAFIKAYTNLAFEMVQRNLDKLHLVNTGLINNVIEQFLFAAMAQEQGLPIGYLAPELANGEYGVLCRFEQVPHRSGYVHTVGSAQKKNRFVTQQVALHLRQEFAEAYERIVQVVGLEEVPPNMVTMAGTPAQAPFWHPVLGRTLHVLQAVKPEAPQQWQAYAQKQGEVTDETLKDWLAQVIDMELGLVPLMDLFALEGMLLNLSLHDLPVAYLHKQELDWLAQAEKLQAMDNAALLAHEFTFRPLVVVLEHDWDWRTQDENGNGLTLDRNLAPDAAPDAYYTLVRPDARPPGVATHFLTPFEEVLTNFTEPVSGQELLEALAEHVEPGPEQAQALELLEQDVALLMLKMVQRGFLHIVV